jgi:hypothetical protein
MPSASTTQPPSSTGLAPLLESLLPFGRDLTRPELRKLAYRIGQERRLWSDRVQHRSEQRHYAQIYRDTHVDVWLICWTHQQDTGFHDHDVSAGAVHVVDGDLVEDRYAYTGSTLHEVTVTRAGGTTFDFEASHVHRIRHSGGAPATSIHVYSPALWRMGYYERDPTGLLRRTSVSYLEETRGSDGDPI